MDADKNATEKDLREPGRRVRGSDRHRADGRLQPRVVLHGRDRLAARVAPTDAAALFVDAAGAISAGGAHRAPAVDEGDRQLRWDGGPATDVLGAPSRPAPATTSGRTNSESVAPPVGAQVVRAGRAVPAGREARGPPPAPPARLPAPAAAAPAARRAPSRTTSSPRRSRSCSCAGDGAEVPIKNSWSGARSGNSTTGSARRPSRRLGTG